MRTIDKIKAQKEFIKYVHTTENDVWETTLIDKDDSYAYDNLMYMGIEDFKHDLKCWGGWMSDDIEEYINEPNLIVENHYLKDSNIIEIESVSYGDKLLMWSLHED